MAAVPRRIEPCGSAAPAHDDGARWRTFAAASVLGIIEVDAAGSCVGANPAFERITGLAAAGALGAGWRAVFPPEDVGALRSCRPVVVRLTTAGDAPAERWVRVQWIPLEAPDHADRSYLGVIEDVTDRHRLETRLAYDATHDHLTGLGSRALLAEELKTALARTRRGGRGVALVFVDLDGFKRVNDTLGHDAGDDLLVQVAQRVRATAREGDVCVRIGGDEFVVCCPDMDSAEKCTHLADRLVANLSEPYDVHGHEVMVTASIGIATAEGDDPVSVDQLLSNADIAAYRAKRRGRGRIEVFDESLRRRLAQGRRIARTVARLVDQARVPMLCTPVGRFADGTVVGFDCAVDWAHVGLPDVNAVEIVVAEAGMAEALDIAMIRTALAHLADSDRPRPHGAFGDDMFMSVVLSRSGAVSPVVAELVRDTVARSRVTPASCWIGIPDAAVAHDPKGAAVVVEALSAAGVLVALRDFRSAVSSIEHLLPAPAHALTLSGPLVQAMRGTSDDVGEQLLRALVQYARALGRVVVADGVVDDDHAARLAAVGCDLGIGPAFGPVVRAEEIPAFRSP